MARDFFAEVESWIRVAKGDVVGHEFHGNQYQSASGTTQITSDSQAIAAWRSASEIAARANALVDGIWHDPGSPVLRDEHSEIADEHFEEANRVRSTNPALADAHVEAGNAHEDAHNAHSMAHTYISDENDDRAEAATSRAIRASRNVEALANGTAPAPSATPTPTPNPNKFSHPYQTQYSAPNYLAQAAKNVADRHLDVAVAGDKPEDLNALADEHQKIAEGLRDVADQKAIAARTAQTQAASLGRQDPDEGEKLGTGREATERPANVTAESLADKYSPAGASNSDANRNRIAGMTSSRLEDLKLASNSMSKLADMSHGYASSRVRGELGSIREAIQSRITDLKNEAKAGGSKFVQGQGNQPTRTSVDYKNLISKLTSASKSVSELRTAIRRTAQSTNHYYHSGQFAKDAPAVADKVADATQAYNDFYRGTDGKDTGYFANDRFKKSVG